MSSLDGNLVGALSPVNHKGLITPGLISGRKETTGTDRELHAMAIRMEYSVKI